MPGKHCLTNMRVILIIILSAALAAAVLIPLLSAQERISVNTATAAQLQRLPRVNREIAADIIAEREARGPYTSLADLQRRVRLVGPRMIEGWAGMAVAVPPPPD